MSTYRDVAEQLYGGLDKIRGTVVLLHVAGDHAVEAAEVLALACAGSGAHEADAEQSCALWREVCDGHLIARCREVVVFFERYLHDALGMSPDRVPLDAEVVLAGPVSSRSVDAEQREHIYRWGVNRKKSRNRRLTGHHHRPEGEGPVESSFERLGDLAFNGVYEARLAVRMPDGSIETKSITTMFPDAWSEAEVAQAIRAAFANRIPCTGGDGEAVLRKWEGFYRNIRIRGYIRPGVEFADAVLDDVNTMWPIYEEE